MTITCASGGEAGSGMLVVVGEGVVGDTVGEREGYRSERGGGGAHRA